MELSKLKAEAIRHYTLNKQFLSSIDFWSQITKLNYFTFKVAPISFRYLKSDKTLKILDERVSSGRLSLLIEIPQIKLEDYVLEKIEVLQDVDIKEEGFFYQSVSYSIKKDFNTRNVLKQKPFRIFDAKLQMNILTMRAETSSGDILEFVCHL